MIAINSVTVLGAGTMGAQIALHCANTGIPVLLLDLTPDLARQGLETARKLKPDPQFTPDAYRLVTTGGFDTHLDAIGTSDWIMEAVVERLDIKQQLLARVDEKRRPGSIVSTNTSGIPIAALAEGRSDDFRRHWIGTHFFNPPLYLHLLEIIPTAETDPAVIAAVTRFGDHLLGKGVVVAKDTPNFVGNHIALYGVARTLEVLATGRYTIEEIDAITGPALGRPGSATFRTMDIAGVDILAHVLRNLHERLATEADRAAFAVPPLVEGLIARGQLGEKTGKGFYERRTNAKGESEIWTLDPATFEYRAKQPARIASIEAGQSIDDLGERVRAGTWVSIAAALIGIVWMVHAGVSTQGLLGMLPGEQFEVKIQTNRDNLAGLLASAMMTGYFLRQMEQRMELERSVFGVGGESDDGEIEF